MGLSNRLIAHQAELRCCRLCPDMIPPVITGNPVASKVLLIGQAPGAKEAEFAKPFAWTAGKTLFKWFASIGVNEETFRQGVYMSAVCRCFPGKKPNGGDRVPSAHEMSNCAQWINREIKLLNPKLIIPVGKLAIQQFMPIDKLKEVVGRLHPIKTKQMNADIIPLPHPSGASTWHRTEPGASLLLQALNEIACHPAWLGIMK